MGIEVGRTSLALEERVEFLRTLGGWLTSGGGSLPLNEAVKNTCEVFSREEYRSLEPRMEKITREFSLGRLSLTESLRVAALGFTSQELSIMDAAERNNQLRVAVPSLVEALDMRLDAQRALKRKLMPLLFAGFLLIIMSVCVMVFMLPTVMGPTLERKEDALEKFPIVIQMYWHTSVWLRANPFVPVGVLSFPVVVVLLRNTPFVKPRLEKVMMSIAPLRRLIISYNAMMVVYFMPALVRATIPPHEVLRYLAASLNNNAISGALRVAANNHESGMRLGESLRTLPFRSSFSSAVEAGERTGKIAERVEDLKKPYMLEFDRVVRRTVSALTFMVMAILMPFFIMSMYTSLIAPIFALMEY